MTEPKTKTTEADKPAQEPLEATSTEVVAAGSTAVEPAQGGPLVTADDEWGDVSDGDLAPEADIRAGIPLLDMNRKLDGGFVDTETGELRESIDFVWMAKAKSRAYWPEAYGKGDAAPTCRSFDGVRPDDSSPERQAETCASCPHSRWSGGDAPACKESIEAMVALPGDHEGVVQLRRVRFGGIANAPAREFWRRFSASLPRRPAIAYLSRATLVPTETKNGKFLAPTFQRLAELRRVDAQPLIDERDRRLEEWKQSVAEDVATAQRQGDEDVAGESGPFDAPAETTGTEGTAPGSHTFDDGSEPF